MAIPKKRLHLTLTDTAVAHLCDIAHEARLSKSETVERLIRSTPIWEGASLLNDEAWPSAIDYSSPHESL